MAEQNAKRRYAAFISYSHRDEKLAAWLHRALETYRTPSGLVGKPGEFGPVPKRLGRCFRDRAELSATDDLGREIREALDESDAVIVLCSPASAGSTYVAEEIRYFKSLGRGGRILAAIAGGEPHAAGKVLDGRTLTEADECFPLALQHRIGADGQIGGERETAEVMAADFRQGKDEREAGKLKLIAALLGVRLDDLVQRERAASRRRTRLFAFAALSFAALAVVAVVAAFEASRQRGIAEEALDRAEAQLRIANARRIAGEAHLAIANASDLESSSAAEEALEFGNPEGVAYETQRWIERAALLSVESLNTADTQEGQHALRASLALLLPAPAKRAFSEGGLAGWAGDNLVIQLSDDQSVAYNVVTRTMGEAPNVATTGYFSEYSMGGVDSVTSSNGRLRVTVPDGGPQVILQDTASGERLTLEHEWANPSVFFSADSRWLVTVTGRVSMDAADSAAEALPGSAVRIWETASGRLLFAHSFAQTGGLHGIAVSPDGNWIAIMSSTQYGRGGIALWPIPPDLAREHVCHGVSRNLSESEWTSYVRDRAFAETCPGLPAVEQ